MMQVVTAFGHLHLAKISKTGARLGVGRVAHTELAAQLGLGRLHPQHRRHPSPPCRHRHGTPVEHRIHPPMGRIASKTNPALLRRDTEVPGKKGRPGRGEPRVVGHQPCGKGLPVDPVEYRIVADGVRVVGAP